MVTSTCVRCGHQTVLGRGIKRTKQIDPVCKACDDGSSVQIVLLDDVLGQLSSETLARMASELVVDNQKEIIEKVVTAGCSRVGSDRFHQMIGSIK